MSRRGGAVAVPLRQRSASRRLTAGRLRSLTPRSLATKLALLFFGVTAVAFSIVFFVIVPELESNLTRERVRGLERVAEVTGAPLEQAVEREIGASQIDRLVRNVADSSGSVVTLFGAQRSGAGEDATVLPYVISDSRATTRIDRPVAIAEQAFTSGQPRSRIATVLERRVVRVARPIEEAGEVQWVAVWTRDLEDVAESVSVVRAQVLIAGAAALLVALVGGWFVARGVARRVARLENASGAVAAGIFPGPLPIDSEDELGQLTRTFNQMQAQLSRVDRARKEFIATASHELRTPIFSLGGFVELLRDEEIDSETRDEFLATMAEQVERLKKLSVDLLDLSRLDAGTLELRPETVNVAELARAVAAEFRPQVKGRSGRLDVASPEEGTFALCDAARVAQILRILIDNALRHTPEDTPVALGVTESDGAVRLAVTDHGPGLDDEALLRVFDRFYTRDEARGSGLGLAIARELAELMDGRITVRSRPGETVFGLELPAAV